MLFGKPKIELDYAVLTPDRKTISVSTMQLGEIAQIVWDDNSHSYSLVSLKPLNVEQLTELLDAINKLNKSSALPSWLKWK